MSMSFPAAAPLEESSVKLVDGENGDEEGGGPSGTRNIQDDSVKARRGDTFLSPASEIITNNNSNHHYCNDGTSDTDPSGSAAEALITSCAEGSDGHRRRRQCTLSSEILANKVEGVPVVLQALPCQRPEEEQDEDEESTVKNEAPLKLAEATTTITTAAAANSPSSPANNHTDESCTTSGSGSSTNRAGSHGDDDDDSSSTKYSWNMDSKSGGAGGNLTWSCTGCSSPNVIDVPACFNCNLPNDLRSTSGGGSNKSKLSGLISSGVKESADDDDCGGGRGGVEYEDRINFRKDPEQSNKYPALPPSSGDHHSSVYNNGRVSDSTDRGLSHNVSSGYGDDYWIDPRLTLSSSEEKWACPLCTFENWPASTKCSMCYTARRDPYSSSNNHHHHHHHHQHQRNNRTDSSNNNVEDVVVVENNRVLSESIANSSYAQRLRNRKIEADSRWLEACRGVVVGNIVPVEEYLARGGDPARQLTASEVSILNRPSAFDVGYTLVHLALRFQHEETLAMLLSHLDCSNSTSVVKRVPSYVAPDLDQDIRNHVMGTIRYGKGSFRCNFSSEIATFTLPAGIHELRADTRETLYDEILDHDVQKELESGQFINWSPELTVQLKSRLYGLWNRSAGDCLLDSVLQATWGIFDKDNRLRQALANSLRESASLFYQRWRENEILLSHMLDFSLDETQCAADWENLLSVAGQPGSSLEQLHIFALAHIFRRPIIVYSVKFVKSYLGETLGYARYEGVYLPLLWDASLCWKWPIALGYTRGHFSALVPDEPQSDPLLRASAAQLDGDGVNSRCTYLPLQTVDGNLLPIHFLSQAEVGNEEIILSQWLDLCYTNSGIMVARQRIQKRPLLVDQLVEEWLNHYRTLGQMASTPYMRQSTTTCYSSDGDSDND